MRGNILDTILMSVRGSTIVCGMLPFPTLLSWSNIHYLIKKSYDVDSYGGRGKAEMGVAYSALVIANVGLGAAIGFQMYVISACSLLFAVTRNINVCQSLHAGATPSRGSLTAWSARRL
jgi:hypothetical protein